jgi:lysine 6-dehydrogenase
LKPGEGDFTIMRITVEGVENDQPRCYVYDLLDRYDPATDVISMARTTGYTCTAVANLVLGGQFNRAGICPPEFVGESEANFQFVRGYLAERGVVYRETLG